MISLNDFGSWISQKNLARIDGYSQALANCIKSDSVVLDLGSGCGVLSLLAASYSAKKVYAVEPNPFIELADTLAKDNGYEEIIECIPAKMQDCILPEKVDILVADVHGALPWYATGLQAFLDARDRYLVSGGRCIPMQENIHFALLDNPVYRKASTEPWASSHLPFDFSAAKARALNLTYRISAKPSEVITRVQDIYTLCYQTFSSLDFAAEICLEHNDSQQNTSGFCLWFDALLDENTSFSCAPSLNPNPKAYGQLFFPFFEELTLNSGDKLNISIRADLIDQDYVWTWQTKLSSKSGATRKEFQQSTFLHIPITSSKKKLANL